MKKDYGLSFISDSDLLCVVKDTLNRFQELNQTKESFLKNGLDPVKMTFERFFYERNLRDTVTAELLRQADKTNTNALGWFHQEVFTRFNKKSGWYVPSSGHDLRNDFKKITIEIKNKHNTMNSKTSKGVFDGFANYLSLSPGWKCYLAVVLNKGKSEDKPWKMPGQEPKEQIRWISIDRLYEIVTGIEDSFSQMMTILPLVIKDAVTEINKEKSATKMPAIYIGDWSELFKLGFKGYKGFKGFSLAEDGDETI